MVKVSVLLSSYNHANFLKQSIDSILNQTMKDFELIIIDDASTDNSWDIIKKYKDSRIIKIRNKNNKGSILTKELVESFKGKYFAVAHCDDYWEDTKLEKQLDYLEKHKKVAACFTWVKLVDENNNELSVDSYTDFNLENRTRYEWLNYFFYHGNCLCHPSVMIRKDVQLNLDLFTYGLRSLPDFYRWVKLCSFYDIYIYPEKLTNFRIRRGGLNTSGYNINNIICYSLENIQIWELYSKLDNKSFLKVFKNNKEYIKDGYINTKFVLARLCIDELKNNSSIFFGFQLIYELFQNEKTRNELFKYYKYSMKDFVKEKQKYDIFNVISTDKIQTSSLFFTKDGSNYNEDNKIENKVLIHGDGFFELFVSNLNQNVNEVRFDPDEKKMRLYENLSIYINNKLVKFNTNASLFEDNKYYFYHGDPMFFIPFSGKIENIYISGKTKLLSIKEYNLYMETVIKKTIELKKKQNMFTKLINCIRNKIKKF